jgi:hypothetical protein
MAKETDYLSFMIITFDGQETQMADSHLSQTVPNEVRFWKVISVAENVCDGIWVGRQEPATADEAFVDKSRAIGRLPTRNEIVVLLVVHLHEVAHEEGGRGWASEGTQGGEELTDEEADEVLEEIDDEGEREEEEEHGWTLDQQRR